MTSAASHLAGQLSQLAPWEWMGETSLIAIEDPGTGRRDRLAIMSMAGNNNTAYLALPPLGK